MHTISKFRRAVGKKIAMVGRCGEEFNRLKTASKRRRAEIIKVFSQIFSH